MMQFSGSLLEVLRLSAETVVLWLHFLSLLKGFHCFDTFQAFLITDFKCCLTPKTLNICNRCFNCQASIEMFLLDMVQTWALAASCMDALLDTHSWA